MAQSVNTYVDVYIWRARNREGYVTTSSEGYRQEKSEQRGYARVGHAALEVFKDGYLTYMSLWPNRRGGTQKAVLVKNFQDELENYERSNPDVIVRLYKLNVEIMLKHFQSVEARIERGGISWDWNVSASSDITNPDCNKASCATFAWSILKKGEDASYTHNWSEKGPQDGKFFNILKCNLAQRFWGMFDGAWWTEAFFTPYALSLRVGSAAESHSPSKQATINIMKSLRVTETKESPWSWGTYAAIGLGAAAVGAISMKK